MADQMLQTTSPKAGEHDEHHPDPSTYVKIAIILTAITLAEVIIYYIDWVRDNSLLVPALIIMSVIKFIVVIGYYMHLKFDDYRFRLIFVAGLLLSLAVVAALIVLLRAHQTDFGPVGFF